MVFVKIIGLLITLIVLYAGIRFAFFPVKSINWLQRIKYQTTGQTGKREKIVSIVFGSLLILIGLYYLMIVILAFIYPE